MVTLRLDESSLSASATGEKLLLRRATFEPLLADSAEQEALRSVPSEKFTALYCRNGIAHILTRFDNGVRVNSVPLPPRVPRALANGDHVTLVESTWGGELVAYTVDLDVMKPVKPSTKLASSMEGDISDGSIQVLTSSGGDANSVSIRQCTVKEDISMTPPATSQFVLRLVSSNLSVASAAAFKRRGLDVLHLGPHRRSQAFGRQLVATLLVEPHEQQMVQDLDVEHCLFLSDHHGILRVMDTSRFGTRVNADRLEPYTPRLLDPPDKVVLLKTARGTDLLAYVVEAATPPVATTPAAITVPKRPKGRTPPRLDSFLQRTQPTEPRRRKRCAIDWCDKYAVPPQGRCKSHTDADVRLKCQFIDAAGVACTSLACIRGAVCSKHSAYEPPHVDSQRTTTMTTRHQRGNK
ncbi:hypothetical protein ACHHYP_12788 [Achlya hypogyna]|uniref:FHA domain-containing protein n=1 Tax=Achlya hypogyna TaxID=1202772 RepID=A0A1V9YGF3_ACHHY|nr:hypothetical protein ACHHYP_12788 [Achlya hypogyna]